MRILRKKRLAAAVAAAIAFASGNALAAASWTSVPGVTEYWRVVDLGLALGDETTAQILGPGDLFTGDSPYYAGETRPASFTAYDADPLTFTADTEYGVFSNDLLYLGSIGDFLPLYGAPADTSTTVIQRGSASFDLMGSGTTTIVGGALTTTDVTADTITANTHLQVNGNADVTGTATAGTLSDGAGTTITGGTVTTGTANATTVNTTNVNATTVTATDLNATNVNITNVNTTNVIATGTVQGGTLTDGTATITGGNVTTTGTVTGGTLTDGTATITGGNVTTTGTVTGSTLTDGAGTTITNGVVTTNTVNATTVNATTVNATTVDATNVEADNLQVNFDANVDGDVTVGDDLTVANEFEVTDGTFTLSNTTSDYVDQNDTGASTLHDVDGINISAGNSSHVNLLPDSVEIIADDSVTVDAVNDVAITAQDVVDINASNDVDIDALDSVFVDAQNDVIVTAQDDATFQTGGGESLSLNSGANTAVLTAGGGETLTLNASGNYSVLAGGGHSLTVDSDGLTSSGELNMSDNRITNLAKGVNTHDAVNLGQLNNVQDEARSGIAGVAALTMIPDPTPGKNYSVGIGFGQYKDKGAGAIGITARLNPSFSVKGGIAYSDGETTGGLGAGFSW